MNKNFSFLLCSVAVMLLYSSILTAQDPVIAYKIETPIVVDGVIDDTWNNTMITEQIIENWILGEVIDEADCHGKWKALWDNTNLYLLVDVDDDDLWDDTEGTTTNDPNDDGLDIVFDADNSDNESYDEDDFFIGVEYSSTGECLVGPPGCCWAVMNCDVVDGKCSDTDDGYIIEVSIPLEDIMLFGGEIFGFDIRINDDDEGGDRDAQIAWFMDDVSYWANPSVLGDVELSETILTGISEQSEQITSYALEQNYPNPFNPNTTIAFKSKENGYVKVEVFNSLGQCVKTLIDQNLDAGRHEINWNANDELGRHVNSGIYFYRLTSPDESTLIKKMILTR